MDETCSSTAYYCKCELEPDHLGAHYCECLGKWYGNDKDGDFVPVKIPERYVGYSKVDE